jgi:hypothetical protein
MKGHLDHACPEFKATRPTRPVVNQSQPLSDTQSIAIDKQLAKLVLYKGYPFNFFDKGACEEWNQFISDLYPNYIPPNRHRIGGELLDLIYNELRSEIRDILTKQPLLNFTLDESIDLAGH